MPCVLLAVPLLREGGDLTSELKSESAAGRSLSPGWLCTKGCGVFWIPGANGGRALRYFNLSINIGKMADFTWFSELPVLSVKAQRGTLICLNHRANNSKNLNGNKVRKKNCP